MYRLFLFLFFLLVPFQAFALSTPWVNDETTGVRLLSGVDAIGSETTIPLALEVKLADGWHTYWRSPGEAGLPPQLDWSRSQSEEGNLQSASLLYPAPKRYTAYGLETVGYRDHVIFPIDAIVKQTNHALNADVSVDLLVCSSVCVPKHFDLQLTLPSGTAATNPASAEAPLINQARAQLPTDPDNSGLLLESITSDGTSPSFKITSRDRLEEPDIFVEDNKNIGFSAPVVKPDPQGHKATLTVKPVDTLAPGSSLSNMPVVLTIVSGDHATEIKTKLPVPSSEPPAIVIHQPDLSVALLFALIGGFILNLMPCVLPVLSLKFLNIVSHGGGSPRKVRQSFLITAAGILFSFLVLACTTITLKHLGLALGWGVQFQQPIFLMFLILLLTFFALNMWGLFEIPLPRFLADTMDKSYHPKLAGDFATGAFATLLSTPCSAPFLGSAVGFALASGTRNILAIFTALGFGMALPYFAIAFFPKIATLLPKPGKWMVYLRQFLGGALAVTALWLTWVLAAQITGNYAVLFGLFMAAIVVLLMLKKRGLKSKLITLGIVEFCIVALVFGINGALKPKPDAQLDRQWIAYNQTALSAEISEGKTVFLDVTADWCLTCKANMKFTLSDDEIVRRLFHTDIIAMQANWTNPDPEITTLLHTYGRYGIPFNIVYGPNAPQGIVLPELLTSKTVLDALDKASKPQP